MRLSRAPPILPTHSNVWRFRKALAKHKIDIAPEYIQETKFDRDSGYRSGIRLLSMLPRPTAIFASNDLMALGALLAARELGLRCPKDISIIGFDNLDLGMFNRPGTLFRAPIGIPDGSPRRAASS